MVVTCRDSGPAFPTCHWVGGSQSHEADLEIRALKMAMAFRSPPKVSKQTDKIFEAITEWMFHISMKAKMDALDAHKAELEAEQVNSDQDPPVLLHPNLAAVYKDQVDYLSNALGDKSTRAEASSIIRSLLMEIVRILRTMA